MRHPRTIRSITYSFGGTLYVITYVAPKEVSAANDRLVTALIDVDGDGSVDRFQPILGTWHDPTEPMYFELAPTSIAIDYSGNNENVYFSSYISTLVCGDVHRQVISMRADSDRLDMSRCHLYFDWRTETGEYFKFDQGDHGRHYAAFNRETKELCIAMGADCDVCDAAPPQSQILCCPTTSWSLESIHECTVKAKGMRNSVGLDFHPKDNALWFTDNMQGRDDCDDKLQRVDFDGQHFGFPFCDAFGFGDDDEIEGQRQIRNIGGIGVGYSWITHKTYSDTESESESECSSKYNKYTPPIQALGAHGGPMGLRFYSTEYIAPFSPHRFPSDYDDSLFITSRGRGSLLYSGYPLPRILILNMIGNDILDFSVFADG